MIHVEELMFGDYVCYCQANGYITRVKKIGKTSDGELGYIDGDRDIRDKTAQGEDSFVEDILHPIPITKEILEKFGFNDDDNSGIYVWKDGIDKVIYHLDCNHACIASVRCDRMYEGNIYDVHELQHAISLCGIRLEVKL